MIESILGIATLALPLVIQIWRYIEKKIESEKYHDLKEKAKDAVLAAEEAAKAHPELYKTGRDKLNAAISIVKVRYPRVPYKLIQPLIYTALKELGLGASNK